MIQLNFNKHNLIKLLFLFLALLFGNLFWCLLANDLKAQHLLTNSPVQIVLSLVFPIIAFGLYLPSILYFSYFEKNKVLWVGLALASFSSYLFILNLTMYTILGEAAITFAIILFLFSYHRTKVIIGNKPSYLLRFSVALTGATLIISFTVAFTFYNFYYKTLSDTNVILSNKGFISALKPVMRVYFDDLNIKNVSETFGNYSARRASETKTSRENIKNKTLYILGITTAQENDTMETLINNSLKNSILKVFVSYKRTVPILISLGLGIITQTLLSVSSFIGYLISILILKILIRFRLIRIVREALEIGDFIPN